MTMADDPHLISQPPATSAHAEVPGEGPTLLHLTSEGWVYVGLTIFLILAFTVGKAWQRIRDALDARIADTTRSLDEAAALKREAEALLAEAKAREQAAAGEARAILAHAHDEAEATVAKAHADAADLVDRRRRIAEDKIAAEERQAIVHVRTRAAEAAVAAAAHIIGSRGQDDRALVDQTIAGLASR